MNDFYQMDIKTILLIDGLDHVLSEVGLQQTILQELPRLDEIPDGFLIILSCQPQALLPGSISQLIAKQVDVNSQRRVEVSGLSRHEMDEILREYGKDIWSRKERNIRILSRESADSRIYLEND